ncbi:hypothetical protein [Variovorax sp. 38R]|uniref:hypothetical protein n=1 Tax=Variovorax sp. 38R TaxID=2774875 RepID=UPI00177AFFE9|nr:hypothetical protein [Variovorax sp. 38R]QOF78427.1 hypothetical protein IG196_29790 [Variovorax sp. 38R]
MNPEATGLRALSHLHTLGLLTDAEHAQALAHPDLPTAALRTPSEALGWAAAKDIVAPEALPGLHARAAPGAEDEAHRTVANAVAMVSGQAPAWVLLEISLMANRLEDGVTDSALDQLQALQLVDPAQHAQALSLLPAPEPEWAAPASPAATLAWAVRTGVLTPAQLQTLASPTSAGSPEGRQVAADALARTERSSGGHTKTVHTRSVTWHSTGASASPRAGKVIAIVALVAVALYFLFAR